MKEHTGERIDFLGGKGGGENDLLRRLCACRWRKRDGGTLLVSTDPAHSLGDLLSVRIGDEACQVTECSTCGNRSGGASRRYLEEVKDNMRGLAAPRLWKEVERQMDFASASPGADEAALFDEIVSVILEAEKAYDRIVFDTAPTGHTLRLLLPELMGVWIEGMLAPAAEKPRVAAGCFTTLRTGR